MTVNAERGKFDETLTMRCDELLMERIEQEMRRREAVSGVPLSRSVMARILVEEALGIRPSACARANTAG